MNLSHQDSESVIIALVIDMDEAKLQTMAQVKAFLEGAQCAALIGVRAIRPTHHEWGLTSKPR